MSPLPSSSGRRTTRAWLFMALIVIASIIAAVATETTSRPGDVAATVTVDPDPTPNTSAVMRYLVDLQDTPYVLSGEQRVVRNFTNDARWNDIQATTGATPAIMGIDYFHWGSSQDGEYLFDSATSNVRAISHWNAGGLVSMNMHAYNPITGASTGGRAWPSNAQVSQMLIPGTAENRALNHLLNRVIDGRAHGSRAPGTGGLLELQAAGVVVLFSPRHEWNFWWSPELGISHANLKGLFDYTVRYVNGNSVHNVLWMYHPKDGAAGWGAPGEGTMTTLRPTNFDIVGFSVYTPVVGAKLNLYDAAVATGKPVFMAEHAYGLSGNSGYDMLSPLAATADGAPMPKLFGWMTWGFNTGFGILDATNGVAYMQSPRVLNRGEVSWQRFLA